MVFFAPSSATLKLVMKPSSFRMRAISAFSLEAGTSTLGWRAWIALRTRVSMSAMGSLVISLLGGRGPGARERTVARSATFPRPPAPDPRPHVLYQLALITPGISPFNASWRKHRRQTPNLRRKARGRPQRQQRLRCRVGSLAIPGLFWALANWDARRITSSFMSFAILAVVAMFFRSLLYCRNGIPMWRSSATPSASVRAVVVMEMFIPLVLSTLE